MNIPMKCVPPSAAVVACREDVMRALQRHADKLTAAEILALMAYTVGQTLACQDQTAMTMEMATEMIQSNIETGNADFIAQFIAAPGGHA